MFTGDRKTKHISCLWYPTKGKNINLVCTPFDKWIYSYAFCILNTNKYSLADSGGGAAHPARQPNGRGSMILYDQNANFSQFFSSVASLAIKFKHNFNRNMAKTRTLKMTFNSTFHTLNDFLPLPPWQSPPSPLQSNPGAATVTD